jgi:uncharacterized protein DUF4286
MILYVVDLDVEAALAREYLQWLSEHVREMLALPGFAAAQVCERLEPSSPGRLVYTVHYHLRDRAAYDAYLREHASRMRADGSRFGDRVRASRSLLHVLQ